MVTFTWENIRIVSLAWREYSPIIQFHWLEWTATGKQTPSLWRNEMALILLLDVA